MTERELRAMNRVQLIDEALRLMCENEDLRDKLAEIKKRNADKPAAEPAPEPGTAPGTLADTAAAVSGILNAAQMTADTYLADIARMKAEQEATCARLISEAEEKCREMERGTQERCRAIYDKANREAAERWGDLAKRLENTMRDYIADKDQENA